MSIVINIQFDYRVLDTHKDFICRGCPEVLLSGLQEKSYLGDFSTLTGVEAVDSALDAAYVKILRLAHHVASLREKRNTFCAISRLPAEMLLQIFGLCAEWNGGGQETWFAFSQVCTSWRRLALARPSLWTHLDLARPRLAELMAQRSLSLPVTVYIASSEKLCFDLAQNRSRIRTLVGAGFVNEVQRRTMIRMEGFLSGHFHALESVHLESPWNGDYERYMMNLSMDAPRLRELTLKNWAIRASECAAFKNLASLSMEFMVASADNTGTYTLETTLSILRNSPLLEKLKLHRSMGLYDVSPADAARLSDVELPHLLQLDLEDHYSSTTMLILHLHMPKLNDARISLTTSAPNIESSEGFLGTLSLAVHKILRIAGWKAVDCAIWRATSTPHRVSADWHQQFTSGDGAYCLEVVLLSCPAYHAGSILRTLFTKLPLDDLVAFHVRPPVLAWLWSWASQLHNLRTVKIQDSTPSSVTMRSLFFNENGAGEPDPKLHWNPGWRIASHEGSGRRAAQPFPALRELILCDIRLDEGAESSCLAEFLRARREQNMQVETILVAPRTSPGEAFRRRLESERVRIVTAPY